VAGRPLIHRILRFVAGQGVRDVVLNLHHLPETITARLGDGRDLGVTVRYSWESPVLGSAGGPRKALSLLPGEDFFIINGDTLTSVDLHALAAQHRQSGALVTLAVIRDRWPGRYGGVVVDAGGRVHGFVPRGSAAAGYHFVGVQIAHPSVFADLPLDMPAESNSELYRSLISRNLGSVRAFLSDADFWDIGTPADYLDAALAIGKAEGLPSVQVGRHSHLDPSARADDTVIWDAAHIGPRASLERCIIADGVRIPPDARFRNCAIIQRGDALVVADLTHG
jgi:mannose-1-phosphate guanylyltransferase